MFNVFVWTLTLIGLAVVAGLSWLAWLVFGAPAAAEFRRWRQARAGRAEVRRQVDELIRTTQPCACRAAQAQG